MGKVDDKKNSSLSESIDEKDGKQGPQEEIESHTLHDLEMHIADSRATLRRFKLVTAILFVLCLGLLATVGQLVMFRNMKCRAKQALADPSDSFKGNSTSETISSMMSMLESDPSMEQDEELQERMNSIVSHIMKSSNNAIVPRFNLQKRDTEGNNSTSALPWSSPTSATSTSSTLATSVTSSWSWSSSSSSSSFSSFIPTSSPTSSSSSSTSSFSVYSPPPSTSWNGQWSSSSPSSSPTPSPSPSPSPSPTASSFSSSSGSYIMVGYKTVVNNTTITSMHTITESPTGSPGDDKNGSSKGLSKKSKNIVIGCVVGLGVPLLAALGAAIWWYRNRKSNPTGRNYVDSNGRDVGIAVDEDSLLGKLKFWKKRKSVGDFHDDDSLDEDFSLGEDTTASNNNTGGGNSQESNGSAGRSFVVDRPKPLRNTTEQNF